MILIWFPCILSCSIKLLSAQTNHKEIYLKLWGKFPISPKTYHSVLPTYPYSIMTWSSPLYPLNILSQWDLYCLDRKRLCSARNKQTFNSLSSTWIFFQRPRIRYHTYIYLVDELWDDRMRESRDNFLNNQSLIGWRGDWKPSKAVIPNQGAVRRCQRCRQMFNLLFYLVFYHLGTVRVLQIVIFLLGKGAAKFF